MAGVDLPLGARAVSDGEVEVSLHAREVFLCPSEPVASKLVSEQGGAPVSPLGEGARLHVDETTAPVDYLLALHSIEAMAAAHEHDAVGLVIEVVVGLPGRTVRHQQEAVVLEVHLMSVEEGAAPVAESLGLKKTCADDVVRRLRNAYGVLASMRDCASAAQREDPVDVAHAIGLTSASVDAPNAEWAWFLGARHEAASVPHDVAPGSGIPDGRHCGGADS